MTSLATALTAAAATAAKTPTRASPRREHTKAWADGVRTQHAQGASIASLAREHGVTRDCIQGIVDGRYYVAPDRPKHAPIKRSITWQHPEAALPDADLEVLVALDDGDVIAAFFDDDCRRDLGALPLRAGAVVMWCHYPDHPLPPKGE